LELSLDEQAALDGFETLSPNGGPLGPNDAPRGTPPSPRRKAQAWRRIVAAPRAAACAMTTSPFASTVKLEDVLRQIEPDPRDTDKIPIRLAHGRLPFRWVDDNDHLGTLMPFGAPSTPLP